jgi:hypothetical protein
VNSNVNFKLFQVYLYFSKFIFIVAPCILKIHKLLKPANALICPVLYYVLADDHHRSQHVGAFYMFYCVF